MGNQLLASLPNTEMECIVSKALAMKSFNQKIGKNLKTLRFCQAMHIQLSEQSPL